MDCSASKEFTIAFIEIWRENKCLWDIKSQCYKDRNIKEKTINMIAREMSSAFEVSFSAEKVRKKIHTLRGQYRKEVSCQSFSDR